MIAHRGADARRARRLFGACDAVPLAAHATNLCEKAIAIRRLPAGHGCRHLTLEIAFDGFVCQMCQHDLHRSSGMQRNAPAQGGVQSHAVLGFHFRDEYAFVAVADRQVHGFSRSPRQAVEQGHGKRRQVEALGDELPKLKELEAQPVASRLRIVVHVPKLYERREQPEGRARREAGRFRDLRRVPFPITTAEDVQQTQRLLYRVRSWRARCFGFQLGSAVDDDCRAGR